MKAEMERTRIIVGGNLIEYPRDVSTRTADITTAKLLWNSVLSKRKIGCKKQLKDLAKFMVIDVKLSYLNTPMAHPEYMRIPINLIPQATIEAYNLLNVVDHGYVYVEINKRMYRLPQAGLIADQLLAKRLAQHGYYQSPFTQGLWKHTWRSVQFTLIVDDFGIKYEGLEHAQHLSNTQAKFTMFLDYCASYPNAKVRFNASDMQLKIHSDASYLSELQAHSRAAGHFYLGNKLPNPEIPNNGDILNPTGILKHVVSSPAEAEFGGLFINGKHP